MKKRIIIISLLCSIILIYFGIYKKETMKDDFYDLSTINHLKNAIAQTQNIENIDDIHINSIEKKEPLLLCTYTYNSLFHYISFYTNAHLKNYMLYDHHTMDLQNSLYYTEYIFNNQYYIIMYGIDNNIIDYLQIEDKIIGIHKSHFLCIEILDHELKDSIYVLDITKKYQNNELINPQKLYIQEE